MNTVYGWHFLPLGRRMGYNDGRLVEPNTWYEIAEKPRMCRWGFHGSERIIDALLYAPGPIVSWCEFGGDIVHREDKFVAQRRKHLWMADTTSTLRKFACEIALSLSHLWDMPYAVRKYLNTQDESLRFNTKHIMHDLMSPGLLAEESVVSHAKYAAYAAVNVSSADYHVRYAEAAAKAAAVAVAIANGGGCTKDIADAVGHINKGITNEISKLGPDGS